VTAQAQLTFDGQPDPPQIGEWLRCKENQRWAEVVKIARVGYRSTIGLPLYAGDIVLQFGAGHYRVSSPGACFWTKWERVDLDDAARVALEEAQRGWPEP
jgi:hypothetical protein